MVGLARVLGPKVMAEGVETAEQLIGPGELRYDLAGATLTRPWPCPGVRRHGKYAAAPPTCSWSAGPLSLAEC